MRKTLLTTMVFVLIASVAVAQTGWVGIFADPAGASCELSDATPGLMSVYVVHMAAEATACQFSAPAPNGYMGATSYLNDTAVFPVTVGTSALGVSVGYGACLTSPVHALTLNVFAQNAAAQCCEWRVQVDPNVGFLGVVDCNFVTQPTGHAGTAFWNASGGACEGQCGETPTQETTWGKVKTLFTTE